MRKFFVAGVLTAALLGGAKQVGNTGSSEFFGVSGGNVNDSSNGWCCSGTLGAMLVEGTTRYVLSNHHVLGAQGPVKQNNITQPGLIDNGCRPGDPVATYTGSAQLGPDADAAVGVITGKMRADGAIMGIGVPSSVLRPATVGLLVQKSGRTTGRTTGKVSSTHTTVNVGYSTACGSRTSYTVQFTEQVVVSGAKFSAGGDSGSLIVTNDASKQPVALLFAGGGQSTIANPIDKVLAKLNSALGKNFSFYSNPVQATQTSSASAPSSTLIEHAKNAKNARERELMNLDGVIGVGVGDDDLSPGEAFIHVYIDKDKNPNVPNQIDGVRVKKIKTDPFVAYGCCEKCRP